MKNHDGHLNGDQIIRATVDENEKQEFEQVLIRMGDISEELVPKPQRTFILNSQKSRSSFRWQPALATGFAIVLLLMGILWSSLFKGLQENGSVQIVQKMESDQQFVAEITLVEDYALPDRYLYIIGTSDEDDYDKYDDYNDYDDDYYDDEFLEFVLPL
jgi:hypothetical protein